jgi:hypothetical protein
MHSTLGTSCRGHPECPVIPIPVLELTSIKHNHSEMAEDMMQSQIAGLAYSICLKFLRIRKMLVLQYFQHTKYSHKGLFCELSAYFFLNTTKSTLFMSVHAVFGFVAPSQFF